MADSATEPRIAPLQPPYEPALEEMLKRWMPPGSPIKPLALFRTLAVHDELFSRMRALGAGILGHGRRRATQPRDHHPPHNAQSASDRCDYPENAASACAAPWRWARIASVAPSASPARMCCSTLACSRAMRSRPIAQRDWIMQRWISSRSVS